MLKAYIVVCNAGFKVLCFPFLGRLTKMVRKHHAKKSLDKAKLDSIFAKAKLAIEKQRNEAAAKKKKRENIAKETAAKQGKEAAAKKKKKQDTLIYIYIYIYIYINLWA